MANNRIGEIALECAWPLGTPASKRIYPHGKAYGNYIKYLRQMYPGHHHGQYNMGVGCDAFVSVCVKKSGADNGYPYALRYKQENRLASSKKWKYIGYGRNGKWQGGDVISKKGKHVAIVVEKGKKKYIAEAGFYSKRYPQVIPLRNFYKGYKVYRSTVLPSVGEGLAANSKTKYSGGKIKEAYYTKPKNFTDVKDQIYVSEQPDLEKTVRIETVEEDWETIKELCPNVSVPDFTYTYDLSIDSLINEYKQMLKVLLTLLNSQINFSYGSVYITFLQENGMAELQELVKSSVGNFYSLKSGIDETYWVNVYNDFYTKCYGLVCYKSSKLLYKTITTTDEYYMYFYNQLSNSLNSKINYYADLIQKSLNINQENSSNSEEFNKWVQEINLHQTSIDYINSQLYNLFPQKTKIQKEIDRVNNLKINLEEYLKNFKERNFSDDYMYWNKNCILDPSLLNFWIEFLSGESDLSRYSVPNIGIRSYSAENQSLNSIYYKKIPNIIYYKEDNIKKTKSGYTYIQLQNIDTLLSESTQGISIKDYIDELLYQHSFGAEEISMNIIPIYYLEPNTRILVYDKNSHINDEYILTKISGQIGINANMTLTANKAAERLY